jgi:hypothetical protein
VLYLAKSITKNLLGDPFVNEGTPVVDKKALAIAGNVIHKHSWKAQNILNTKDKFSSISRVHKKWYHIHRQYSTGQMSCLELFL